MPSFTITDGVVTTSKKKSNAQTHLFRNPVRGKKNLMPEKFSPSKKPYNYLIVTGFFSEGT